MHGVERRRHLNKLAATGVSGVIPRLPYLLKRMQKKKMKQKEPKMVAYKIEVKNPRTQTHFPLVKLCVLIAEDADHGAFRKVLSESKNVISYDEEKSDMGAMIG